MKKAIIIILGIILMLNISSIETISDGEKTIKVYGTVELDGNPVEDADISVKNLDKGYEESTTTDDEGYYEVYINGKNNDEVSVEVEFDDVEDYREFEIVDGKNNYEFNFEFESSPVRKTYHKFVNLFFGLSWGFWEWLVVIFMILVILCMIKKIFFERNGYRYRTKRY